MVTVTSHKIRFQKKRDKISFFFLAGVISKKPGLKFEKKIPEQPLGRL
jgi:hypothetical protein